MLARMDAIASQYTVDVFQLDNIGWGGLCNWSLFLAEVRVSLSWIELAPKRRTTSSLN